MKPEQIIPGNPMRGLSINGEVAETSGGIEMLRGSLVALVAVVSIPAAGRAADVAPLYPDAASFAFGLDVKAAMNSPLGKTVIGDDRPFDATRKLLKVFFPEEVFRLTDKTLRPLETVANRLERVTVVGDLDFRGRVPIAVYLEGAIDEDEYVKAAEAIAKAENQEFATEKLGDRKLIVVGKDFQAVYGVRVSESLFLFATTRELVDEVLDKHAGKKKASVQKALAAALKKVKPAETPVWLVVGEMEILKGVTGGVATIGLADDAAFRMDVACDKEEMAATIERVLKSGVDYLAQSKTPQGQLWDAARITVKRNDLTVTAAGSIPGKRLAEEYAKQK
jgi:hypothetical protein